MNSYAVKPKYLVLKGGESTIIFHGLPQLRVGLSVLSAEAGASGAGARGGADAAPPAFVGDGAGEGGAGAAATGDDWEIVGNTEQPAQTVATAERPAAVTGALLPEFLFEFGLAVQKFPECIVLNISLRFEGQRWTAPGMGGAAGRQRSHLLREPRGAQHAVEPPRRQRAERQQRAGGACGRDRWVGRRGPQAARAARPHQPGRQPLQGLHQRLRQPTGMMPMSNQDDLA